MKNILYIPLLALIICSCMNQPSKSNSDSSKNITKSLANEVIKEMVQTHGYSLESRIERGVNHIASLWRGEDGTPEDFKTYCKKNFIPDENQLQTAFAKISRNLEQLYGHNNTIYLELQRPIHEPMGDITPVDEMFGSFSPDAHLTDDMFASKLAFYIALNFPYYTLEEKNELGKNWTRLQWAYARLGDLFRERIPAELKQKNFEVQSKSDIYISTYNIYAGNLRDENGKTWFPKDMVLLAHWNLRDELKANYNKGDEGLKKQTIIYEVMKRIIDQTIPKRVINDSLLQWDPVTNKVYSNEKIVDATPENGERYQQILNNFHANKNIDAYSPMNTFIKRSFGGSMELTQAEVEKLFIQFLSSDEIKKVADLIKSRLGRDLQPWDIWYDGFKSRSSIDETKLDKITQKRFPNAQAFKDNLPVLIQTIGFNPEMAAFLSSKIDVDPARGSGHAWGAQMKGAHAHLRTRIPESGMNYKGYNIAIHELGHNVEQTISLYLMDYYMLNGVPNTAFTEALAFVFQKRDLPLLGIKSTNPKQEAYTTLDNFWSTYEIMGVSLLDQYTWKWMYEHPDATAAQLKEAVVQLAINIWNDYYAPVFGIKDQPVLAIYSHMISNPLYLSNYAIGSLVEFQTEEYLKSHDFAPEILRMYKLGRLTPNIWMVDAVGNPISIEPMISEVDKALNGLD